MQISAAAQLHPRQISSLAQEVAVFACGYKTGNHPSRLRANAEANVGTSLPMIQTCLCFGATMRATNSAGAIAIGRCVVVGSTQTQKYIRFVSLFFKLIQRPHQPSADLYLPPLPIIEFSLHLPFGFRSGRICSDSGRTMDAAAKVGLLPRWSTVVVMQPRPRVYGPTVWPQCQRR